MSRRIIRRLAALLLATAILAAPGSALAASEDSGALSKFFFGITAAVCTLVYTPLKIVYAVTSIPLAGLVYTWSVGDTEMTERVVRSGTQGNWVVTPEHIRGQRSIDFVGKANEGPDPDSQKERDD
jgi:hypothetical protein